MNINGIVDCRITIWKMLAAHGNLGGNFSKMNENTNKLIPVDDD